MISHVTETVPEIESRPHPKEKLQLQTWYVVEEVDFGNWGIRANVVIPEILKSILEG